MPSIKHSLLLRYGIATLAVAAVILLKLLLDPLITQQSPFLLMAGAVMVGAWFGGLGPGVLATVLGALAADYFFLEPVGSFTGLGEGLLPFTLFVLQGLLISVLVEALHSSSYRAETRALEIRRKQEELRRSEERFRLLVEGVRDYAIFMLDTEGRVTTWNRGAERLFGYTEREIVGEPASILFTPEDIRGGAPERELRAAEEEGRGVDERRHVRKDGSEFWASGFVRPIRDDAGNLRGFAKVARDITGLKETEDRLRESEERFRTTFEQAAVGVAHVGPDGRWLRVNNRLCEITGYPRDELLELTFQDITHPDDLQKDLDHLQRLLAGEIRTYSTEKRYICKDGSVVWINLTVSAVVDASGQLKYFITVVEDISERKNAEEALNQSEERYRAVVKQSTDGIYLVDGDTRRILETNPALQNMLGYSADELLGMELHEIVAHDRQSVEDNVERTLREGKRFIRERNYLRKDGRIVEVEVAASAIYYGGKRVICAALRDITERKRAEAAMNEVREAERQRIARDLHDDILQDIVYALQEIQIVQVISEDGAAPGLEEAAEALRRSVEGLRSAVFELRLRETLGRSFVSSLEALLDLNRRRSRTSCEFELIVEDGFPRRLPERAGRELVRIVQEALVNVRRHARAGRVRVRLWLEGDLARVEVADDGRGFDPENQGVGVGQQSMLQRAREIGGVLEVESAPGGGTRVRFEAPVSRLTGR